jgi:hypothetical protein
MVSVFFELSSFVVNVPFNQLDGLINESIFCDVEINRG